MNTHQELAIRALESLKGDDLYRYRRAFAYRTQEEMDKPYYASGKTCAELLAAAEAHEAKVNAAIAWVRSAGY